MNITLDITSCFNRLFYTPGSFLGDYQGHTVIFWDYPDCLAATQELYLTNFMLNIEKEMLPEFNKNSAFNDISNANFAKNPVAVVINKKAKICFTGIKGADLEFVDVKDKKYYHSYPYRLKKNDYYFNLNGFLEFSPDCVDIYFIADQNATASITFDSNSYILIDPLGGEAEKIANMQQAPHNYHYADNTYNIQYKYNAKRGKMFDYNFRVEYFFDPNWKTFAPEVALKDE